ncbi:putative sodium-coupled neutral amino acid transporter 6-like [Hibiscus syriacus]|uniref:Sodium-coupled neutral amino acid transporter 6-like n=1 Tax=Hibiscus syriacus TaxID=106335 RepID=A0A6A3B4Z4_HIBSY|nr:uncharacterized protein LOC120117021 [Hibiscus syriacus]KAE8710948.1 putative sodium-coupled neutral amino acid transporter 6-like [Hibiscus syriacus]
MGMDWFSWLSKTGLHSSLVDEYAISFSHNELEEEDIVFFNHEFLQSMGISIAKRRLEILKFAIKNKALINRSRPMSRLVLAVKTTKRIRSGIGSYGNKWKDVANAMFKRKKTMMTGGAQGRLIITNGAHPLVVPPEPGGRLERPLSPVDFEHQKEEETKMVWDGEDGRWLNGDEEIRWDAMFQDLKPT